MGKESARRAPRPVVWIGVGCAGLAVAGWLVFRHPHSAGPSGNPADQPAPQETLLRERVRVSPKDPRPRLQLVAWLLESNRVQEAYEAARDARTAFPDSPLVARQLAEAQFRTARRAEAVTTLRPLAATNADDRAVLVSYLIRMGRRNEALQALDSGRSSTASEALQAAKGYLDALRADKAAAVLAPFARSASRSAVGATYGVALLLNGQYGPAARELESYSGTGGSNAASLLYSACSLLYEGTPGGLSKAESELRTAASAEPRNGLVHYELAVARMRLRDWTGARASMDTAAGLSAAVPEVQRDQARLLQKLGERRAASLAQARYLRSLDDAAGAAKVLRAQYTSAQPDIEIGLSLASALFAARKFDEAQALLTELGKRRPDDPDVLWAVYRFYRDLKRWKEAGDALDQLEHRLPSDLAVQRERAGVFQSLGKYDEEERILTHLQEQESASAARCYDLGRFLQLYSQRPDRLARAEQYLRKALALQPDFPDARYALGAVLEGTARPGEAVNQLRAALDAAPEYRDALRSLGRAYQQLGNRAGAEDAFALLRRLQQDADALNRYEIPVSQFVDLGRTRKALARYLLEHGSESRAVIELEAAEHEHPADRDTHALLEQLYAHARRFQRQYEERQWLAGTPNAGDPFR